MSGIKGMRQNGIDPIRRKFNTCKQNAKRRGIDWNLSLEQWIKIWIDSGHFSERGRQKDKYVMARFGDIGPYSVSNVKIIKFKENSLEAILHTVVTPEGRERIRKSQIGNKHASGRVPTQQHRDRLSAALSGKSKSAEAIKNMTIAQRKRREKCVFV